MNEERSYRVERLLGSGTFGDVYLAETVGRGISAKVAIKKLRAERAAVPGFVKRLKDEARVLSLVRHRAIVRVDDLVELNGDWSIVMEYVDGCDVSHALKSGTVPPRAALSIAEEVASALHVAYGQPGGQSAPLRLVHRDIKPGNIRVTPQGDVKLLDFGVSRAEFAGREAASTLTGFGTIAYMAAERFDGEDTHAGDVYSLGVTLFEMLTGVLPGSNAMDADRQPPGRKLVAAWDSLGRIHPGVRNLVAQMLSMDPGDRPTARECARKLAELGPALRGEALADWAERVVPGVVGNEGTSPDTGSLLVARSSGGNDALPRDPSPAVGANRDPRWLVGGAVAFLLAFVAGALMLGSGLIWLLRDAEQAPVAADDDAAAVSDDAKAARGPTSGRPAEGVAPSETPEPSAGRAPPLPPQEPAEEKPETRQPPRGERRPAVGGGAKRDRGTVVVEGRVASFALESGGRSYSPGPVPAGSYTGKARFSDGTVIAITGIVVEPGGTSVVRCNEKFRNCSVVPGGAR